MSLIIDVPPKTKEALHREATRRGLSIEVIVYELIERAYPDTENTSDSDGEATTLYDDLLPFLGQATGDGKRWSEEEGFGNTE